MSSPGGREVSRLSVRIVPDTSGFRRQLQAFLNQVERTVKLKIPVELNDSRIGGQLRQLQARLKAATAGGVNIPVKIDQDQLGLAQLGLTRLGAAAAGSSGMLTRFGGVIGGVGVLGQVAKFQVVMAAGGLAVGAFGTALAVVSPAVLGLSGALAIAAGGAGVLALGMDGIKRAALVAQPAFHQLKATISATFEQGLIPVFTHIANSLIPAVTGGLVTVASALVGVAQNFTHWLIQTPQLDRLRSILGFVAGSITALGPVLRIVTDSFLTLAQVGTAAFQRFASGPLTRVAEKFNEMASALAANGTLARAFDGLGLVVEGIGNAFTYLLEVGARLSAEFGGQIGDTFTRFGQMVKDNEPAIRRLTQAFLDFVNWLITNIPKILPHLEDAVQGFRDLGKIIDTIAGWGAKIDAFMKPVTDAMNWLAGSSKKKTGEAAAAMEHNVGQRMPAAAGAGANRSREQFNRGLAPMPIIGGRAGQGATQGLRAGLAPMPGVANGAAGNATRGFRSGLAPTGGIGRQAGSQGGSGFVSGIRGWLSAVISVGRELAAAAFNAAKSWLLSRSPSRRFMYLGEDVGKGFVIGMQRMHHDVERAGVAMVGASVPDLPTWVTGKTSASIESLVSGSVDLNPQSLLALANSIIAGITGSTLRVDGRGVAALVNSTNQRNLAR